MSFRSLVSFSFLALFVVACGSSGGGTGGTGGSIATTSSSSSGTGGAGTSSSATSSSSSGTGGSAPITKCADIGATDCFSNYDCASSSDRCENRGTESDQVPCCVAGARGAGQGGDPCQNENDCDSAVCVTDEPVQGMNRCSKVCDTDADCPADLPNCVTIVAGANGSFCL